MYIRAGGLCNKNLSITVVLCLLPTIIKHCQKDPPSYSVSLKEQKKFSVHSDKSGELNAAYYVLGISPSTKLIFSILS